MPGLGFAAFLISMQPISFHPIYKERIWGGRQLEETYNRTLPKPTSPFGEAWEIVDREDAQSIVSSGQFSGKTLNELWSNHREEIFGKNLPESDRFPLLIKILDCADDLSLQVHPPAGLAEELGGEPKTEMWFIADCKPEAKLYVGLKKGATRATFEKAIQEGTVADQVHAIAPQKGQSILLESGRLHAIGAGFLIHEIQQNSDTTYRVFDWNRTDAEGNPRDLHVEKSLACIDFEDTEPEMDIPTDSTLATCSHFTTTRHHLAKGDTITNQNPSRFSLLTIVKGSLEGSLENMYSTGQTILLPVSSNPLVATETTEILQIAID